MDDEARHYLNVTIASYQAFDKAVSTIAGGALGLSVTFMHDIATPQHAARLALSWVFLTAALLSSMLSFLLSAQANERYLEQLSTNADPSPGLLDWWTRFCNWFSVFGTAVGVGLLAYFAVANLNR